MGWDLKADSANVCCTAGLFGGTWGSRVRGNGVHSGGLCTTCPNPRVHTLSLLGALECEAPGLAPAETR